jgi:hypothetical protein
VIAENVRSTFGYGRLLPILPLALILTAVYISRVATSVQADAESPFCSLPPDPATPWLPVTPEPNETGIPSPRPASDCQFYRPAWQRFLVATQPTKGVPAFLRYPSFYDVFAPTTSENKAATEADPVLDLLPRNIQRPNDPDQSQQKLLDDTQAGINGAQGGYLIDQHGRFVYYAIHINPAFLQFLRNQKLLSVPGIQQIDKNLTVLGGHTDAGGTPNETPNNSDILVAINTNIVEYKSAWMIVDRDHPPSNYFVVSARVPHYIVSGNSLTQEIRNGVPRTDPVKVALLALHVVFTLPGHPEMVWSTFEHVHKALSGGVVRDNAPAAADNPSLVDPNQEVTKDDFPFPLYKAHTLVKNANQALQLSSIVASWDEGSQSFTKGGKIIQTSVYRPYPGSKTDGSKPNPDHGEDDEVIAVNQHATSMFDDAKSKHLIGDDDQRQNYRLAGAIWLDQPMSGANPFFAVNKRFSISMNQSTDDSGQPIAGEGRLGSTAMESFTESEDLAPNCFSCHDTRAIRRSDNSVVMGAARLNVSHLLSKYLISQSQSK